MPPDKIWDDFQSEIVMDVERHFLFKKCWPCWCFSTFPLLFSSTTQYTCSWHYSWGICHNCLWHDISISWAGMVVWVLSHHFGIFMWMETFLKALLTKYCFTIHVWTRFIQSVSQLGWETVQKSNILSVMVLWPETDTDDGLKNDWCKSLELSNGVIGHN